MMVKMKILVLWGFNKKSDFKGGSRKQNNMQGVIASKGEGVWTDCRVKGGGGVGEKEEVVLLMGRLIRRCTCHNFKNSIDSG